MNRARLLLVMLLAGTGWSCAPSQAAEVGTKSGAVLAVATCGTKPACAPTQYCFNNNDCRDKLPKDGICYADGDCVSNSCPFIEGSCISKKSGFNIACKDDGPCDMRYGHGCDLPQKTCK
jgi:hypothetical protein